MPVRKAMQARYPADWKARSRFVRFHRARNRCEWCGAENHRPHPQTGAHVVLTVAHVFDKRPEACGLLNLAALCQRFHNRHDARDSARDRRERRRGAQGRLFADEPVPRETKTAPRVPAERRSKSERGPDVGQWMLML